jgi:hypothetical protein
MEKCRESTDCKHYPICKDLKTLVRDIPVCFSGLSEIVFQAKAEWICIQCNDFEPKEMLELS